MNSKAGCPAHIAEHVNKLEARCHYLNYAQGAEYYDLSYWTFVNLAKKAGATVNLHLTAIVETGKFERYLEEDRSEPVPRHPAGIVRRGRV